MYFIKYGKEYLHDPRLKNYMLLDISFTGKENSFGDCDFTIYPEHPMYDKIKERDADNPIEVYDGEPCDENLIFSGFIYELGKEFYLDGHVKCKGELAYLMESIVRPYSTLDRGYGNKAPNKPNEYFEWLIDQHNNQVSANKQFTVGINEAFKMDSNSYIFRENDAYPNTFDEISDKLLNSSNFGGYLRIRHENGIRYIDYLVEWTDSNSQTLEFGKNLTNYSQVDDSEEIYTFVVPLGAKMNETDYNYNDGYYVTSDTTVDPSKEYYTLNESGNFVKCNNLTAFESGVTYYEYVSEDDESDQRLNIKDAPDGSYSYPGYIKSGDMIYYEEAVNTYGWIGYVYSNQDLTIREHLINRGIITLMNLISPKRTIEIKAIDMHLINPDIKPIKIGEYVRVKSDPHKLDSYFLCRDITLNLNNPEQSIYTLGTTYDTLTGQQNKQINKLNETINSQYESTEKLSEELKESAKEAATSAEQASSEANEAMVAMRELSKTTKTMQEDMDDMVCSLFEATLELESRADDTDDAICELYEATLLM